MKAAFLLGLFLLGACHIDARHSKHHKKKAETPADHEISTQSVKPAENFSPEPATPLGGFAFPGFRIRIPILNFGVLGRMKQQIDNIMNRKQQGLADLPIGGLKAGKTKTRTKMSNSTHGPFKTYTITTETLTQGNKTVKPKVIAKTVKTITTLDKSKLAKAKNGTVLPLAMGPRFGMTSDSAPEGKKCHASGDCQGQSEFCDAFYGVCRTFFRPGDSCTQKDACDSQGGRFRCTWGRCVLNSYEGSAGTFCDSDSECQGSTSEELGCFRQPDLSRLASVCTPKLTEGATCGRAGIFDLFKRDEELSSRCRNGLQCRAVGFFGRKACIRPLSDGMSASNDEKQEDNDEEEETSDKENDAKKTHKVEHKKNDKKLRF